MREPNPSLSRSTSFRGPGDDPASTKGRQDGSTVFKTLSDSGSQLALNSMSMGSNSSLQRKEKSDSAFQMQMHGTEHSRQAPWTDLKALEDSIAKISNSRGQDGREALAAPVFRSLNMDGKFKGKVTLLPKDANAMDVDTIKTKDGRDGSGRDNADDPSSDEVAFTSSERLVSLLSAYPPYNVLLVDMRSKQDFLESRLHGSVNVSLPAIILKRFRKGSVSTVSLTPFLTTQESKTIYHDWRVRATSNRSAIVVYDYDTTSDDIDSDVFTLSKTLQHGLYSDADENIPVNKDRRDSNVSVSFLQGGFSTFVLYEDASQYLAGAADVSEGGFEGTQDVPSMAPSRLVLEQGSRPDIAPPPLRQQFRGAIGELRQSPQSLMSSPASTLSTDFSPTGKNQRKRSALSIHTPLSATKIDSKLASSTTQSPPDMVVDRGINSVQQSRALQQVSEAFSPEIMDSCSKVNDYLFLGSDAIPTADDAIAQLQALGVTHVLNMAAEINSKALLHPGNSAIVHKWLKLQDSADQEVEEAIKEGIRYIDDARANNPAAKVLVHCRAGKSRSVTMVLAYLIQREGMTLKDAYEYVRGRRSGVAPNIGFMLSLMRLEKDVYGVNTFIST
ncbi:hypothetical protein BC829DRAFT_438725 [Chytridium lagenaria]|nr:hypothetical protein BC829DRAFT_438725 [Chytridium lagenaria]